MIVTVTVIATVNSISIPFADLSTNLDDYEVGKSLQVTSILSESKHWIVVQLPIAYMATNWPIRVSNFFNPQSKTIRHHHHH